MLNVRCLFFRWEGANRFTRPGSQGVLTFYVTIWEPGLYKVRVRNFHDFPDDTEENDCWMGIEDQPWVKVFSNTVDQWTFITKQDFLDGTHTTRPPSFESLGGGTRHRIRIAARSHGFAIDRVHVYQQRCSDGRQDDESIVPHPVDLSVPSTSLSTASTASTVRNTRPPGATEILVGAVTSREDIPIGKREAQGATANGKLYVFGGFSQNFQYMDKTTLEYDPVTDNWEFRAAVPVPETGFTHAANAADGNIIYLVGGLGLDGAAAWPDSHSMKQVLAYNAATNTWDGTLPDLPEERGGGAAVVVNGGLHFFGGAILSGGVFVEDCTDHWSLDLTMAAPSWVSRGALNFARNHLGAGVYNGKIYAIGGQLLEDEGCSNQIAVEEYDSSTDVWLVRTSLETGLGHLGPAVLSTAYGIVIVGGVHDSDGAGCSPPGNPVRGLHHYDPETDSWMFTSVADIGGASCVSGFVGNSIYTQHNKNTWQIDITWQVTDSVVGANGLARRSSVSGDPETDSGTSGAIGIGSTLFAMTLVVGMTVGAVLRVRVARQRQLAWPARIERGLELEEDPLGFVVGAGSGRSGMNSDLV